MKDYLFSLSGSSFSFILLFYHMLSTSKRWLFVSVIYVMYFLFLEQNSNEDHDDAH